VRPFRRFTGRGGFCRRYRLRGTVLRRPARSEARKELPSPLSSSLSSRCVWRAFSRRSSCWRVFTCSSSSAILCSRGSTWGGGSSRLIARRMGDRRPSAPAAWSGAHDQERPRRVLEPGRRQPPQQILDRLFGDPKIPADVHGREFFAVDAQADRVDVFAQRKASTTGPRRAAIRAPGKPSEISPRTKDASASSSARWPRLRTRNGHPIRRRRRRRRRLTTSWKPPALSGDAPKIGGGKPRRKGRNLTYSNTL